MTYTNMTIDLLYAFNDLPSKYEIKKDASKNMIVPIKTIIELNTGSVSKEILFMASIF
jgi:hypothetical protein